jgi:4-hydroxyphenylpyruvate dioxygenase
MTMEQQPPGPGNPLGMDGIEFIEFATSQPQALGAALEAMGFRPGARHRSREVMLYRQGSMNMIVNAHSDAAAGLPAPAGPPVLSAIAFRVRDAAFAWRSTLDLGAWEIPTRASAMELNIPGIHGVGDSLIYFVDRYKDFAIYDVDFVPLVGVDRRPPALAGLHYFGVVQTIARDRTRDWTEFYRNLFGFAARPDGQDFGMSPEGTWLESPCRRFHLQILEPPPGPEATATHWDEALLRVALGAPDVLEAVRTLRERGAMFVDRDPRRLSGRGALTQPVLGGVTFELVISEFTPDA